MNILETRRRDLVAAPLLAMAAMALRLKPAEAAGVDPTMTIVTLPGAIPWKPLYNFPPGMAESAAMFGDIHAPGQYFVLIRWHPGYMSAPHWYETDRLSVVLSGTWYVASGEDFAPDATIPVPLAHSSTGWRRPLIMTGSKKARQSRQSWRSRALGRSLTT
jgi:hypothetical protein